MDENERERILNMNSAKAVLDTISNRMTDVIFDGPDMIIEADTRVGPKKFFVHMVNIKKEDKSDS